VGSCARARIWMAAPSGWAAVTTVGPASVLRLGFPGPPAGLYWRKIACQLASAR
jgi:hypothetical protein